MAVWSVDIDGVVSLDYLATTEWDYPGEHLVRGAEPGDLGEQTLGTEGHSAAVHVVLGAVPRAHHAAIVIDRAAGEVGS